VRVFGTRMEFLRLEFPSHPAGIRNGNVPCGIITALQLGHRKFHYKTRNPGINVNRRCNVLRAAHIAGTETGFKQQ
jgi:hypothetical protein